MNENSSKVVSYMIMASVAYFILQAIMPLLVSGVICLVMFRLYELYQNNKR